MESQDIIDILTENNTKCSVCGSQDFKVEILVKHLLITLMKFKERPQGIHLIVAECKNCKNILIFNSRDPLDQN